MQANAVIPAGTKAVEMIVRLTYLEKLLIKPEFAAMHYKNSTQKYFLLYNNCIRYENSLQHCIMLCRGGYKNFRKKIIVRHRADKVPSFWA